MSEYNRQHAEAIRMARAHLESLPPRRLRQLRRMIDPYLDFRRETGRFQEEFFKDICSRKCFSHRTSECCGREGILVFFADVVISLLLSTGREVDALLETLEGDTGGFNCVYLREDGCLWRLKPVACEMFLCDPAKGKVFAGDEPLGRRWETLRKREHLFTRPTRPVLFDELENVFIEDGFDSPLMYFHHSPGLLRLKAKHGL